MLNDDNRSAADIARGRQLAALRSLKLKTWRRKSATVSGTIQKAVLKAIDDHQGRGDCFATQATIAVEVGCSEGAVGRAIAALVDHDLITKERRNHWSPNHHRINWTAVMIAAEMLEPDKTPENATRPRDGSTHPGDVSTRPHDVSDPSTSQHGPVPTSPLTRPHEVRNAPLNETLNATTNRPDDWAAVVNDLLNWGLKSAHAATDAARCRGLSIRLVRELWMESGGGREPERWEPGQLANWLTGAKPAPIDEAAAERREQQREATDRQIAEKIRGDVCESGNAAKAPRWVIAGTVVRRLRDKNLERFATPAERRCEAKFAEFDRSRRRRRTGDVVRLGDVSEVA